MVRRNVGPLSHQQGVVGARRVTSQELFRPSQAWATAFCELTPCAWSLPHSCSPMSFLRPRMLLRQNEKGDGRKTDRCIDACIAAQRSCVVKATSFGEKAKCATNDSSCSTKCPLPNGGEKNSKH